jgi:hypothetical protein
VFMADIVTEAKVGHSSTVENRPYAHAPELVPPGWSQGNP